MPITITCDGARDTGSCPCCGSTSRTVWGYAFDEGSCIAVYYVHWTVGEVLRHGATFDLILGDWEEAANPGSRRSVCLAYRVFEAGPSVMVIDAGDRPPARSPFGGQALARSDVIGTPVAEAAFGVLDAIMLQDPRIAVLHVAS